MPDAKISALGPAAALAGPEFIPMVQAAGNVYGTPTQIAAFVLAQQSWVGHPGYVAGRYYSNRIRYAASLFTASHAADTIHYTLIQIFKRVTITSLGVRTGTANAAAGNANIGWYSNNGGNVGALLSTIATGVAIPGTALTNVTVTPAGGDFIVEPGTYWLGVQLDATIIMSGENTGDAALIAMGGTGNAAAWFGTTSSVQGFTEAKTYASGLPANATGVGLAGSVLTSGIFRAAA